VTKDFRPWDSAPVADLVTAARAAEVRVCAAAGATTDARRRGRLARAVRELLALQSSDWAFLVTRGTAGDYPVRRWRGHASELDAALARAAGDGPAPDPAVRNLAPHLDLVRLGGS
jgi:1,4-alpha-glucan branching enzyme